MLKIVYFIKKILLGMSLAAVVMILVWQQAGKDPRVETKRLIIKVEILYNRLLKREAAMVEATSDSVIVPVSDLQERMKSSYNPLAFECPPKQQAKPQDVEPSVYVWKDESGKTHFSDIKPKNHNHSKVDGVNSRRQYFNLVFQEGRSALPPVSLDRIEADVYQIFDILYRDVASIERQVVTLNLRLFANRADFLALQEDVAPHLSKSTVGFYTGRANYAAIDASGSTEVTTTVIRHESTHALVSNIFGYAPVWFNEGMAMYFEGMKVVGQLKQIGPNNHGLRLLDHGKGVRFGKLVDYFSISGADWYIADQSNHNYAVAWSLVHHLMSSDRGKQFLSKMMLTMADQYCQPLQTVELIEDHYSGGLIGFERDWRARLQADDWAVHRY